FEADVQADQRAAVVALEFADLELRTAVDGQALEPAPGEAEAEQLQGVEEGGDRLLGAWLEDKGEQAAGAGVVAGPEVVAGVAGQGRVDHPGDLRLHRQPARP